MFSWSHLHPPLPQPGGRTVMWPPRGWERDLTASGAHASLFIMGTKAFWAAVLIKQADLGGISDLCLTKALLELKKQLESAELKNQRLREIFGTKIQEFRKVCYKLTGYHIDITIENQYRLTSVYAERREDCLIFKTSRTSGAKMQLLENDFSQTIRDLIDLHLLQQDSIPAFLSAVTLELFSRQTMA